MSNSVNGVKETECCGCGACYQICPKKSIRMEKNERGFLAPIVDERTCIKCGACLKVCPEVARPQFNLVKKSYVAIAENRKLLMASTSGGVFGALAEAIISEGGSVYGCAWDKNLCARHIRIEQLNELHQIQKSKYVQSDTNTSFIDVRNDLKQGRKVLYSGTACQIAGLRKFLNGNEGQLITIEVACHGVPSPGLFQKYIKWRGEGEESKVVDMQFRDKEKHKKGEHYMFFLKYKNGEKCYYLSNEDSYYGSFLEGRTLRETCYHCKYKEQERVADILLGDYWGIEKEHKSFPARYGASAVIIASEKGEKLFNRVRSGLRVEDTTFEKIVAHNKSIISCASCSAERKLKSINITPEELFKELKPKFSIKKRIKNMIPENVKYLLKRI
ncbi:MAG: Coenzyme F420 hydrogenase/dehydrogenase, beta subunit C-terminal domain [Anaerostipes sp.]|nr:Coenzyme F420 hydrogenase/dehydrogenase, beta subunit C-terminal domain [Anaerostipes sp.]